MDCNCYVSLWIFWIDRQIAVGKGTRIGTEIFPQLTYSSTTDIIVGDVYISSVNPVYWLFDFPTNATSACTTHGLNPATTNPMNTTSTGFNPTTINTKHTTLPGLNPTTISTIETRTRRVHPTSNNTTSTTIPGFRLTSMIISETTTSGFSQEPKSTNAPTKTTRPGYNPTTTSTTETSPAFNPTIIGSPETTTPGFDPTSVGTIFARATTTSGTTKNIETTSTKMPCICSCNNLTLTEDELNTRFNC
ncbi:unnamed protein product [Mytilus edulis]|uniref:Uncharacterized protein n=1 Tax=Mytilus edulis TaxID=6550 RepID=A0A8S3V4Q8_MYTED|nr:unnamed protein product [Mytilus edulis]